MRRVTVTALAVVLLVPVAAQAVITFTQIDNDIFIVSHRIKVIGSRAKAMRVVYEKAASVCVAAGYAYFKILDQESDANQQDDAANASVRVQFFSGDGEGRIECEKNSSPEYVEQARQKLSKRGYQALEASPTPEKSQAEDHGPADACSLEQIAAMARAGLSDEQIRAACEREAAEAGQAGR